MADGPEGAIDDGRVVLVVNLLGPRDSVAGEGLSRMAVDLLVIVHRRMRGHSGNGRRKHGGSPVCSEATRSAVTAQAEVGPIHATCVPPAAGTASSVPPH